MPIGPYILDGIGPLTTTAYYILDGLEPGGEPPTPGSGGSPRWLTMHVGAGDLGQGALAGPQVHANSLGPTRDRRR